jgi:Zn-dependent metalloprotease
MDMTRKSVTTRRWTLLAGALALSLAAPQAAFASPQQPTATATSAPDPAATALRDLKADADGAVTVTRDASGEVSAVRSTDGQAMLESDASTPRASAQEQLAQYGDAFGIDGSTSKAVVTQTLPSSTGGSVVRADQVVDGVPVFGGQVVLSLDDHQDIVSVTSATTDATDVASAVVGQQRAERTAVATTAKSHRVSADRLTATFVGRRLYDPALVHVADPMGARPVWQFTVTNGSDINETVLVGTDRGEVALHFNDAPEINRRICDNMGLRTNSSSNPVPLCNTPVRIENGPASVTSADVNSAYDNLGATSDAYAQLAGVDLTDLIGVNVLGTKTLESTVRWCYQPIDADGDHQDDYGCPYDNAFWDGTQMVFGNGDDVIFRDFTNDVDVCAHELSHGVTQYTAGLVYTDQAGALNEAFSDIFGSCVDQYVHKLDAGEHNWLIGEGVMSDQLYGEAIRSMSHPGTAYDNPVLGKDPQAGHMSGYVPGGDPHINSGIVNRAFYLTAIELGSFPAAQIWYGTLLGLFPNAQFSDCAYLCAEQARILARDGKVGRNAAQTVRAAFHEVGIG